MSDEMNYADFKIFVVMMGSSMGMGWLVMGWDAIALLRRGMMNDGHH